MTAKFKLYATPISPFAYLIQAALIYKKIDFEYIYIDLGTGKQKTPEYLALNPFGQVPLLVTPEGVNLYESWAIFEYLEEAYPEFSLLPLNSIERAKLRSLCMCLGDYIIPLGRELMWEKLGLITLAPEALATKQGLLLARLTIIEQNMQAANISINFSAFDAMLYQVWNNLNLVYPEVNNQLTTLKDYVVQLANHPVIATIEDTDIIKTVRKIFKNKFKRISD